MGKFIPGQSGNPGGRPKKGETLTDLLRVKIEENYIEEFSFGNSEKKPAKDFIAGKLIELAINGSIPALRLVFDRLDGPLRKSDETPGEREGD